MIRRINQWPVGPLKIFDHEFTIFWVMEDGTPVLNIRNDKTLIES